MKNTLRLFGFLLILALFQAEIALPQRIRFTLKYDTAVSATPVSGRVYVIMQTNIREQPFEPDYADDDPFFAMDVHNWKPGEEIVFDKKADGYPLPLKKLKDGIYVMQAVLDLNPEGRSFAKSEGNGYSKTIAVDLEKDKKVSFYIDKTIPKKKFAESEFVKEVNLESKLVSAFYGRPTSVRAAVVLPASYHKNPSSYYPTVYIIPGFSGTHYDVVDHKDRYYMTQSEGIEKVYVILNPACSLGHHEFADSENCGPRAQSLLTELIPHIEKTYRVIAKPDARFLWGHSSGGWSTAWLMVNYPDYFAAGWAMAPDPVDFRDFQQINLYDPNTNVFWVSPNKLRYVDRLGLLEPLSYKQLSDKERVIGYGEQLNSYEGVFSPRGADGKPMKLWDRDTGKIDPKVAEAWKKYDIRLVMENNWATLYPKIKDKLHIIVGDKDHFYLEKSVEVLKKTLDERGSTIDIQILPNHDHISIYYDFNLYKQINKAIDESFMKHHAGPYLFSSK